MSNPFSIVKDSSIWKSSSDHSALMHRDAFIRIGIVRSTFVDADDKDLRFLVEIQDKNNKVYANARVLRRFGGVYNYEDIMGRGYQHDDKPDPVSDFSAKAGDMVAVAFLNGSTREAIIIGGLLHPARGVSLDYKKGPQYISEFNGVETSINDSGEYKLVFKAQPVNLKDLSNKPTSKIKPPKYDDKVGGSYFWLDKTGSIEINDSEKQKGPQSVRIDKPKGMISIQSGKIKLEMSKEKELVTLKCKVLEVTSDNKITNKTKEYKTEATTSVKINSPKVAIGKEGIELLDQLFQLVEMLGKVTPISPVGPCTPLMSTPQWSQVKQVQSKIKEITGSL